MKKLLFIAILLTLILSCKGIEFASTSFNERIPEDLKNRTFWKNTDIFKYELQQLTGSIIFTKDDGETYERGARIIRENKPPVLKLIKDGYLYTSKVDNKLQTSVTVLSFSSSLNSKQAVDVKIADISRSFINYEDIPIKKVIDTIKKLELSDYKKYYIQGALLTSIVTTTGTEIDVNAKAVAGSAYGAEAKVYNEKTESIRDYKISLLLIDLDKVGRFITGSNLKEDDDEMINILKASSGNGISLKEIKDLK
ncbi:MAG: hypothetical protein JXQ93_01530 [Flavobacteriaceae bacterium]